MLAMDLRPIGVFDSGVGGLTVLHECLVTMPNEDFVYLGDHARLPYGPRPLEEIRRFAREIGASTLSLDPIEGVSRERAAAGAGYVDLMEANLASPRTGAGCA